MKRIPCFPAASAAIVVGLIGILQIFLGERIYFGHGLGWDGIEYAAMVKQPSRLIPGQRSTSGHGARILPSAAVFALLKLTGTPIENRSIINGFCILNAALLSIAAYAWVRISAALGLSSEAMCLGLILGFVNFALLKMPYYYPVLMDTAAFALSMLLLLAYLRNSAIALLVLSAAGAMVWPTLLYSGLLLFVLPRTLPASQSRTRILPVVSCAVLASVLFYTESSPYLSNQSPFPISALPPVVLFGSTLVALTYLYYTLACLWRNVGATSLRSTLNLMTAMRLAIATGLFFALGFWLRQPAGAGNGRFSQMVTSLFITVPYHPPGTFLVANAVYFGPVVLLGAIWFKDGARLCARYGLGIIAVLAMMILTGLSAESRFSLGFLPFLVLMVSLAADERGIDRKFVAVLGLLAIVLSKFWMTIGPHEDLYFMNFGTLMATKWYLLQGGIVVLTAFGLFTWTGRAYRTPKLAISNSGSKRSDTI